MAAARLQIVRYKTTVVVRRYVVIATIRLRFDCSSTALRRSTTLVTTGLPK